MNNGHYSVDIDIFRTMKRRKARLIGERESPRAILSGKKGSGPEPIPIGLNQRTARLVIYKTGIADHHSPGDTSDYKIVFIIDGFLDCRQYRFQQVIKYSIYIQSNPHQSSTSERVHTNQNIKKSYFGLMVWINSSENKIQCTMLPLFMCDYMYDVQMHVSWTWLWKVTFQNRTWDCQHL